MPWRAIEEALAGIARGTVQCTDVEALTRSLGADGAELERQCLAHRQQSAAASLSLAQTTRAHHLLTTCATMTPAHAARLSGFADRQRLDRALCARFGLAATALQRLPGARSFQLHLPPRLRRTELLAYIGRDPRSVNQQRVGDDVFAVALSDKKGALTAKVRLSARRAEVTLSGRVTPRGTVHVATAIGRLLGIPTAVEDFEERTAREPDVARLVAGRRGLRVSMTATAFDAVTWSIIGQQVSLAFAYQMLRYVCELAGTPAPGGLTTMPLAERLAALSGAELAAGKFSAAKARYLIGAATLFTRGALPLDELATGSAEEAYARLIAVKGLGPWSVNYIMMRGLGFADCAPLGDAGLRRALHRFHATEGAMDAAAMEAALAPFRPHRSLASFHLWRFFDD